MSFVGSKERKRELHHYRLQLCLSSCLSLLYIFIPPFPSLLILLLQWGIAGWDCRKWSPLTGSTSSRTRPWLGEGRTRVPRLLPSKSTSNFDLCHHHRRRLLLYIPESQKKCIHRHWTWGELLTTYLELGLGVRNDSLPRLWIIRSPTPSLFRRRGGNLWRNVDKLRSVLLLEVAELSRFVSPMELAAC